VRRRALVAHALAALALALPARGALAQAKPAPAGEPAPAVSTPPLSGGKRSGLDDEQKLARADASLVRVRRLAEVVAQHLVEARAERDILRAGCLGEKVDGMKGLVRVAEQAAAALQEAIADDEEGSEAELTKLELVRDRAVALRAEAEACVGRHRYDVDEKTTVEVQPPKAR